MKLTDWSAPISDLFRTKNTKTCQSLEQAGIKTLIDLIWIFPSRIEDIPPLSSFNELQEGNLFQGHGIVVSLNHRRNFYAKGRRGIPLTNISLVLKDTLSEEHLTLNWYNTYPSLLKKLQALNEVYFFGTASIYKGSLTINNPELLNTPKNPSIPLITYPTVNHIGPNEIAKLIKRIPLSMWDDIPNVAPHPEQSLPSRGEAFKILHGRSQSHSQSAAKETLAYEEFFCDQVKIWLRREKQKDSIAPIIRPKPDEYFNIFPYQLTDDQINVCQEIHSDFISGRPMMRLLQGDVGCGKTTVALIAAYQALDSGYQVALMCPTESLALQHYHEFCLSLPNYNISLLTGSLTAKKKKEIHIKIKAGDVDFVVGTHSLIQDNVEFNNLGFVIIDEQHKFGVNQRIRLTSKQTGVHCLIMSATPIPRSLSMTNYGDLDLSIIKMYPKGRSSIKTRIVEPENFERFLSFVKTRLSLGEQAYIVTPSIHDNDSSDMMNLERVFSKFQNYFPEYCSCFLHGQVPSQQKQDTFLSFSNGEIDLLISTSVIEVGINVPNATVMAILSPERFGLSSLHQLRGRVGRGSKPGFCFLVSNKELNDHSMNRLKVIESTTDGFFIAEEDLRLRGEGELFGFSQSGDKHRHHIANIHEHFHILKLARSQALAELQNPSSQIQDIIRRLGREEQIFSTI